MFRPVPLSIISSFSLYTQQWFMSCRFADSLLATEHVDVMLVITEDFPSKKVLRLLHWRFLRLRSNEIWHPAVLYTDCFLVRRIFCHISGFRRDVAEVFAIVGCNASYAVNRLWMFRDSLSVPSPRLKQSKKNILLDSRRWDSLRTGSGWNILILLASCQQTSMTYTIAVCTVKKS